MENNGLIEVPYGNKRRLIFITANEGFEPMFECKEILTNKLGFVLKNECGITDMQQEYEHKNKQYLLKYDSGDDMIVFVTEINNDIELDEYRQYARLLIAERKKKINNVSYNK